MQTYSPSFYIFDYETFGTHPALDRPSQFAGIRVDQQLNPISQPLIIYCKQSDDYLPNPEAVIITGITPQECNQKGVTEAEFTRLIHQEFTVPNTCLLGYNTIQFDDEVTRHLFYRNFYDPYAHHWQNGNSRWDMIDVVRATYALRPEGINWPLNDDGVVNFRLEALTKANSIAHEAAHDAMSDVSATIDIMRLVMSKQPRLFQYLYQHRDKHKLIDLIDLANLTPLVHISSMYGAARKNASVIVPLAWHPTNKNSVIAFDLNCDPSYLLTLSSEEIREKLYTPKSQRDANFQPIGLINIALNKCPVLAPYKTLLPATFTHLELDESRLLKHKEIIAAASHFRSLASEVFEVNKEFEVNNKDVDNQLYDRFFSQSDKYLFEQIRTTPPKNLPLIEITSEDDRISPLFFRYKARNFPSTLDIQEQELWLEHRKQRINRESIEMYVAHLESLAGEYEGKEKKLFLLKRLFDYLQEIAR